MRPFIAILTLVIIQTAHAQSEDTRKAILEGLAKSSHKMNFGVMAARLETGINIDSAYKELDHLLKSGYGDMFWMYGLAGLYMSSKDELSDEWRARIRNAWKEQTPYRGDTENHFLMYYGALYLVSQEWPDLPGSEWFTGQSSSEIHAQSKEYLTYWIDTASKAGLVEFDSPRYLYYFITPLSLLAEHTTDPVMKQRFALMLELLLLEFATEYMNGAYVGAHARTSDQAAIDPLAAEAVAYGKFFFEDSVVLSQPDIAFAALAAFECPAAIRELALQKNVRYEHIETHRSRPALRLPYPTHDVGSIYEFAVPDYTYRSHQYAMGSVPGWIAQPIQQQSWSLVLDNGRRNNTIVGLHPDSDMNELRAFFPEEPTFMIQRIGTAKAGYPNQNKWLGGSAYERLTQNRNVLHAEYRRPPLIRVEHVDLFIPNYASVIDTSFGKVSFLENSSWMVLKLDEVFVGIGMPLTRTVTSEAINYRIRLPFPERGTSYTVVVSDSITEVSEFKSYLTSIAKPASPIGDSIHVRGSFEPKWRMKSPFVSSTYGSGIYRISIGGRERELNFINNTVTERALPASQRRPDE